MQWIMFFFSFESRLHAILMADAYSADILIYQNLTDFQ